MKKLVLIFGVFAIICVIISFAFDTAVRVEKEYVPKKATVTQTNGEMYTVKAENGRVVLYKGDTLILRTTTSVSTLPKKDERTLLYGITVSTREQADEVLEQYCS